MSSDGGYDFFGSATPNGGTAGSSAPAGSRVPAAGQSGGPYGRAGTPSHLMPETSRWAKSDTTFGPVGRVVTSILMVVPLLFFIAAGLLTFDPFVLIGAVIWAGLMFVGMKHIWAPVRR